MNSSFKTASTLGPEEKPRKRGERTRDAIEYYAPWFKQHNIVNPYVTVKPLSQHYTKSGEFILWILVSEAKGDVYLEVTDADLDLLHTAPRRLYRIRCDEAFKARYAGALTNNSYRISFNDLEELPVQTLATPAPAAAPAPAPVAPATTPATGMAAPVASDVQDCFPVERTLRDEICIQHLAPFSNKPWVNALIRDINQWKQQQQAA